MLIRIGYDIGFEIPSPVTMVGMLHVHPSRNADLLEPDDLIVEPSVQVATYLDGFGNRCSRFLAPQGTIKLHNRTLIQDSGEPDISAPDALEIPVHELPNETLQYLLNSRYCEVDRLFNRYCSVSFGSSCTGISRASGAEMSGSPES